MCDSISSENDINVVFEPARKTSIYAKVDVLVAGGGPAGIAAALAAAKENMSVMIVERNSMLGGVWTAGLVNPLFDFDGKGWVIDELVSVLQQKQAWGIWNDLPTFDPEMMKFVLEQMMISHKVQTLYATLIVDTIVNDDKLEGVIVENKSGRQAILADTVIDCTGDGDVAAMAGVPFDLGRSSDGLCQPMTLMFEVKGIDGYHQKNTESLYDIMSDIIKCNDLDIKLPFARVNYAPWLITVPRCDTAAVQATHIYEKNPLDASDITNATISARKQVHELMTILRKVPGLEGVTLTQTAPSIGVREARHLQGQYTLELPDLQRGCRFDDAVASCSFGVDIHDVKSESEKDTKHHTPIKKYHIPYRCLVPKKLHNLIFAGRCISGSHEAHASYRVTGTCMAMGQAAGLAAALAIRDDASPHMLNGTVIASSLRDKGVNI